MNSLTVKSLGFSTVICLVFPMISATSHAINVNVMTSEHALVKSGLYRYDYRKLAEKTNFLPVIAGLLSNQNLIVNVERTIPVFDRQVVGVSLATAQANVNRAYLSSQLIDTKDSAYPVNKFPTYTF